VLAGMGGIQGVPGDRVAQCGEDAGAVLGGGGDVAADGVPVAGGGFGAEPPGYFCWVFAGRRSRSAPLEVGGIRRSDKEPQDVMLTVVQVFQQHPGRRLLLVRAAHAAYLGQAHQDAVAEQPQVRCCSGGGDGI
jgi:hypothetical protein